MRTRLDRSNPSLQGTGHLVDRTLQGVVRCSSCPECGGELVHTERNDELGDGYRVCRSCGQEWWTGIDYPEHINKKLNPKLTVPPLSADTVGRAVGTPDQKGQI